MVFQVRITSPPLFENLKACRSSTDVVTFSNTSQTSHFLAASLVDLEMVFLNSMTGSIIRQVKTTSPLTHLELSHSMLLSGSSDGYLRVHDLRTGMGRTGATENLVKAHSSSIEGVQTAGNFVDRKSVV